jgi:hypothetical protein
MKMTADKYPVPSEGSLICTRFDCPDRIVNSVGVVDCNYKIAYPEVSAWICNYRTEHGLCPRGFAP